MRCVSIMRLSLLTGLLGCELASGAAESIGTGFSYRGSLSTGGMPANGTYDLKFTLFDTLTNGTPIAVPITNLAISMNNGLFNAPLDFGFGAFDGTKRWLEIGVRSNGVNADFEVLTPRQELAPQVYALYAARAESATVAQSLAADALAGQFSLTNSANVFRGDGKGLTGVVATALSAEAAAGFWQIGGNAGTTGGPNFLGTTDNQPLELKVANTRALLLAPNGTAPPNLIGGSPSNMVVSGVVGGTIGGGGAASADEGNSIGSIFGTVAGGSGNAIGNSANYGNISGGHWNSLGVSLLGPTGYGDNATIGGGRSNWVAESDSVIAGGRQNRIGIGGGGYGLGGHSIGGGIGNGIHNQNNSSTISGGLNNFIDASEANISGGTGNSILWMAGLWHSIGGGLSNQIWATLGCNISGGSGNSIGIYLSRTGGDYSTIGGGQSNTIGGDHSIIGGGFQNLVTVGDGDSGAAAITGGISNQVTGSYGTIPGGLQNFATNFSFAAGRRAKADHTGAFVWADSTDADFASTVNNQFSLRALGGVRLETGGAGLTVDGMNLLTGHVLAIGESNNVATGAGANIDGGADNLITNQYPGWYGYSAIGGGSSNAIIDGAVSLIAGGQSNILNYARYSTISGGAENLIWYGEGSTIAGGYQNRMVNTDWGLQTIGGGGGNEISGRSHAATIAGGEGNWTTYGRWSNIGGGQSNIIDSYYSSAIGGGSENRIGNWGIHWEYGDWGTIAGGHANSVLQSYGTIGGGNGNSVMYSFSGQTWSYGGTIGGGQSNLVNGFFATIPGGALNTATNYSLAAGYRAKATHEGAFVWASGNTNDFPSINTNSFHAYTPGGFEVDWGGQDTDGKGLRWVALAAQTPGRVINTYSGAYLSTGGNWVDVSDRAAKKDFAPVRSLEILDRVVGLPLSTWSYRSDEEPARHLGPVAQDFHAAFGLGADDKHISALDSSGVALAAIQGLNQKLEQEAKERNLEIQQLKRTVEELKKVVNALAQKSPGGAL
jgi:trimeric autotransporter adhesin